MRTFLLAVLILIAAFQVKAQSEPDIQAVIGNQFDAFSKGDLERAYSYASPMIQTFFPTPDVFGQLVRRKYPMIWAPEKVTYLGLRHEGERLLERVQVIGTDGALSLFDYEVLQVDGLWRINGVFPVRVDGVGV